MVLDRLFTDSKGLSDVAIPRTGGDQGKHFELARSEWIGWQVLDRSGEPYRVDDPLQEVRAADQLLTQQVVAVRGAPDRRDQLGRIGGVGNACDRPHFSRADDAGIVVSVTHDHERGLGRPPVQLSGRLSRIEPRKVGLPVSMNHSVTPSE